MTSDPYPLNSDDSTEFEISGLDISPAQKGNPKIFQGATVLGDDGKIYTTRGKRVVTVVASGETTEEASENVYEITEKVSYEGKVFMADIRM